MFRLAEVQRRFNDLAAGEGIDHIARVDIRKGIESAAFQMLLRLLDTGKVWVRLSDTERMSATPPTFSDVAALAKVAKHAPDRVVWGTDWPHPNIKGFMPNDGGLADLIPAIAPTESIRRKVLVDNPEKLFVFKPLPNGS